MFYKREQYLDKLISLKDTNFIKLITGVRSGGKSVLLQQYREYLQESGVDKKHIIYIDLESYVYRHIHDGKSLLNLIIDLLPKDRRKIYLQLDEIQSVINLEETLDYLGKNFNIDISITSSSNNLLFNKLSKSFPKGCVKIVVYPLSFKEFFHAKGYNMREVDIAYKEYVEFGGFPGVVVSDDDNITKMLLEDLFNSILVKDKNIRKIRNISVLRKLALFLSANVGEPLNPSKISNILNTKNINISNHTINKYLQLLCNTYLFDVIEQYDISKKSIIKSKSKYFSIDYGLTHCALSCAKISDNALKNIVYIELLRRGYNVISGRINNKEIDFIAKKDGKIEYYQVCHQIPENSSRESDNLLMIKDNYPKTIITGRCADFGNINGVNVEYIVDWLLS